MEQWKTIPFEQNYEVSTYGNVRNKETLKVKRLRKDSQGYLRVTLYPSGKTYSVHRLVALTWLESSYEEGLQVDHLNAIKTDNRVENLEWVTLRENLRRIKRRTPCLGENNGMVKLTESDVFNVKYRDISKTNSELAKELGVEVECIRRIRTREQWVHVIDSHLEVEWLEGRLKYSESKFSNLAENKVNEIREFLLKGKGVMDVSRLCGVSRNTVSSIKKRLVSEGTFNDYPTGE